MTIALVKTEVWRNANRKKMSSLHSCRETIFNKRQSATNAIFPSVAPANEGIECGLAILNKIRAILQSITPSLIRRTNSLRQLSRIFL
jgi:hypothetical protein